MKELVKKLCKLIDVKSIVTLSLTAAFIKLVGKDQIDGEQFMMIYTTVVAFYFGVQYSKANTTDKNE